MQWKCTVLIVMVKTPLFPVEVFYNINTAGKINMIRPWRRIKKISQLQSIWRCRQDPLFQMEKIAKKLTPLFPLKKIKKIHI